jgi:hypothetical protein
LAIAISEFTSAHYSKEWKLNTSGNLYGRVLLLEPLQGANLTINSPVQVAESIKSMILIFVTIAILNGLWERIPLRFFPTKPPNLTNDLGLL